MHADDYSLILQSVVPNWSSFATVRTLSSPTSSHSSNSIGGSAARTITNVNSVPEYFVGRVVRFLDSEQIESTTAMAVAVYWGLLGEFIQGGAFVATDLLRQ